MATVLAQPPKCTACGDIKREGNHWFILANDQVGDVRGASFVTWHDSAAGIGHAFACGEKCLHVLISRIVETGTFEAPAVRSQPASLPSADGQQPTTEETL